MSMATHRRHHPVNNPFASRGGPGRSNGGPRTVGYADHRYGNSHQQHRKSGKALLTPLGCALGFLVCVVMYSVSPTIQPAYPTSLSTLEQDTLRKIKNDESSSMLRGNSSNNKRTPDPILSPDDHTTHRERSNEVFVDSEDNNKDNNELPVSEDPDTQEDPSRDNKIPDLPSDEDLSRDQDADPSLDEDVDPLPDGDVDPSSDALADPKQFIPSSDNNDNDPDEKDSKRSDDLGNKYKQTEDTDTEPKASDHSGDANLPLQEDLIDTGNSDLANEKFEFGNHKDDPDLIDLLSDGTNTTKAEASWDAPTNTTNTNTTKTGPSVDPDDANTIRVKTGVPRNGTADASNGTATVSSLSNAVSFHTNFSMINTSRAIDSLNGTDMNVSEDMVGINGTVSATAVAARNASNYETLIINGAFNGTSTNSSTTSDELVLGNTTTRDHTSNAALRGKHIDDYWNNTNATANATGFISNAKTAAETNMEVENLTIDGNLSMTVDFVNLTSGNASSLGFGNTTFDVAGYLTQQVKLNETVLMDSNVTTANTKSSNSTTTTTSSSRISGPIIVIPDGDDYRTSSKNNASKSPMRFPSNTTGTRNNQTTISKSGRSRNNSTIIAHQNGTVEEQRR